MYSILLVEDEDSLAELIQLNLELEGYLVTHCSTVKDTLNSFSSSKFDLILLDVMLPDGDGFMICESIRKKDQEIPIMFLTAKSNSIDKVKGLSIGADDYLAKPFDLDEFLLRVKNLLKRKTPASTQLNDYTFGANHINFKTYESTNYLNEKRQLTAKEIAFLKMLITQENEVISRVEIIEKIWGEEEYPSTRTIDNFILNFRKYFEKDSRNPSFFHSVRGIGYKFTSNY